jgi:hypothetical protein
MTNEEMIKNHSGEMIKNLLKEIAGKDAVDIRFEFENNEQWAIVSTHNYEEDKEISLRLHNNNRYELYFGYYNDDDEFFEITQPLTSEEKNMIPKGLHRLMAKVVTDEKGMRLPGNLLSK